MIGAGTSSASPRIAAATVLCAALVGVYASVAAGSSIAPAVAPGQRAPTIGGELRPAWLGNGDGSAILGGRDGTGRDGQLGHIRWTIWSATMAVGWGVEWERCTDSRGCARPYELHSRRLRRIVASVPIHGVFTHLRAFGCEVWRGSGVGYDPVDCRTWRP